MSTITTKGQIVIPSKIRKDYDLKPGTKIRFHVRDGEIVLTPMNETLIQNLRGKYTGASLVADLKLEKKKDRNKENR